VPQTLLLFCMLLLLLLQYLLSIDIHILEVVASQDRIEFFSELGVSLTCLPVGIPVLLQNASRIKKLDLLLVLILRGSTTWNHWWNEWLKGFLRLVRDTWHLIACPIRLLCLIPWLLLLLQDWYYIIFIVSSGILDLQKLLLLFTSDNFIWHIRIPSVFSWDRR